MSINPGLFMHKSTEWETPNSIFNPLSTEFNIILDVCATQQNKKCNLFFDRKIDGLKQDWSIYADKKEACWMNPPYGSGISSWIKKAYEQAQKGVTTVALLPARTDTKWFHDYILSQGYEIRFLKGRVRFVNSKSSAPFPSMIVIFKHKPTIKDRIVRIWKKS